MLYGKVIDGKIQYAPKTIDGVDYPGKSVYLNHGYLPVSQSDLPTDDGYVYTPKWVEDGKNIRLEWVRGEYAPIAPEPSAEEVLDIILGGAE